jgi:predicted porin
MNFAKKAFIFSGTLAAAFAAKADDVVIYGTISSSIESIATSGASNNGTTKPTQTRLTDNNSRIGFRGNEDLGNGLKAIWQVETSLRGVEQGGTNDYGASSTWGTRNTFVGLQDEKYGRFIVGYNDNAYKSLVGSASEFGNINVMANTSADTWGAGPGYYTIFSRGETRMKNSMHYTSSVFAGFQLAASYGVDETRTNGTSQSRESLAAKYVSGAWKIGFGYDRQNDTAGYASATTAVSGKSVSYYKLVTSYQFPTRTLLGGGIEEGRYDSAAGSVMSQTGWTVSVTQPVSDRWALKASYSHLGGLSNPTSGSSSDYTAKQWVLGTSYDLSRRTQLFAYYTRINNGADQNVNFGFNPVTTSSSAVALATGSTVHALGLGMSVTF